VGGVKRHRLVKKSEPINYPKKVLLKNLLVCGGGSGSQRKGRAGGRDDQIANVTEAGILPIPQRLGKSPENRSCEEEEVRGWRRYLYVLRSSTAESYCSLEEKVTITFNSIE